jgi:hypothetical protein
MPVAAYTSPSTIVSGAQVGATMLSKQLQEFK